MDNLCFDSNLVAISLGEGVLQQRHLMKKLGYNIIESAEQNFEKGRGYEETTPILMKSPPIM